MNNNQKTIFIVDDEPAITKMLSFRLKVNGYNVVVAHNGLEALQALEKTTPDLIILDLNMPQMGGIEFYHKICDENSNPRYPVFIFTAQAQMEQFFDDFQIAGFVTKPYDSDKLLNDIQSVLAKNDVLLKKETQRQGKLIGIVENDSEALSAMTQLCHKEGYETVTAENATLFIIAALKNPPDALLIKYDLDDIKGDQLIQKLHQIQNNPDTIYVLYSKGEIENDEEIKKKLIRIPELRIAFNCEKINNLLEVINKAWKN